MTCTSCWQPRTPRMVYGGRQPVIDIDGMVQLTAYPDCHEPYNELEHRAETMYIVGWGTEKERVFTAARSKRASAYAKTVAPQLRVDKVLAHQLCRQAVLDAYAADE